MANIDETTIITIFNFKISGGRKLWLGRGVGGIEAEGNSRPLPPTHLRTLDSLTTRLMRFDEMNIDHHCRWQKAGRFPGNNKEFIILQFSSLVPRLSLLLSGESLGTRLTVFYVNGILQKRFDRSGMKLRYCRPVQKGFILQWKSTHFWKICRRTVYVWQNYHLKVFLLPLHFQFASYSYETMYDTIPLVTTTMAQGLSHGVHICAGPW